MIEWERFEEQGEHKAANKMTCTERVGEVKIYSVLFLQDNSLVV